jgi:hypothetical protein
MIMKSTETKLQAFDIKPWPHPVASIRLNRFIACKARPTGPQLQSKIGIPVDQRVLHVSPMFYPCFLHQCLSASVLTETQKNTKNHWRIQIWIVSCARNGRVQPQPTNKLVVLKPWGTLKSSTWWENQWVRSSPIFWNTPIWWTGQYPIFSAKLISSPYQSLKDG